MSKPRVQKKPVEKDPPPAMEDVLTYVEERTRKTLEVSRKAYDDLHERAYKLVTALVAGGGAVIAYVLTKIAGFASVMAWAPLAALALSWLMTAVGLMWLGMTAKSVSPGNGPKNLLGYYNQRRLEAAYADKALEVTRIAELDLEQVRIDEYGAATIARADAIDLAYKTVAICSVVVPATTAILISWLGL